MVREMSGFELLSNHRAGDIHKFVKSVALVYNVNNSLSLGYCKLLKVP